MARRLRFISFAVFLATFLVVGGGRSLKAFSCYNVEAWNPYPTIWFWACGWFDTDPCADGTFQAMCDYGCYAYYNFQSGGSVVSCQSSGGPWWLSWGECYCEET